MATRFEWDQTKNRQNQSKHGVAFELAQLAFADPRRVIAEDLQHSESEKRYYCFGKAGGRRHDRTVYLPRKRDPDPWCRLLAKRKGNL